MIKPPFSSWNVQKDTLSPVDYRLDRAVNVSFSSVIQPVIPNHKKDGHSYPIATLPTRVFYQQLSVTQPRFYRGLLPFNIMEGPRTGLDQVLALEGLGLPGFPTGGPSK